MINLPHKGSKVDKIFVTNKAALETKYGPLGFAKVRAAVKDLIAADAERGLRARMICLDDGRTMKRFKAKPVTSATDQRQVKQAIDAIYRSLEPEYVTILGSVDVVPHQALKHEVPDDVDSEVPSDLPYACNSPYSREISTFCAPTRVVSRLPDLTGANEPSYLLALLATATRYRQKPAADYVGVYFGLSTQVWRESTELSLLNTFGNSATLHLSPKAGPSHPLPRLAPLMHFINCHGGSADPYFYGEDRFNDQPKCFSSKAIASKIREGTLAAVECCYGAQLYDSVTLALPIPICQSYLGQGAYGYFGSSNIAYGPPSENGLADLITQYFLLAVMEGASIGRAALVARQRFVQQATELDPVDLKTLAQFNLLGDASIHPVAVSNPTVVPKGITVEEAERMQRRQRRAKLRSVGELLLSTKPTASKPAKASRKTPTVAKALANIGEAAAMIESARFMPFEVKTSNMSKADAKAAGFASRYYVAHGTRKGYSPGSIGSGVVAVAKESAGRITGYRIYVQR